MSFPESLTTREIGEIFGEEVMRVGGRVTEAFLDEARYVGRSVLPDTRDVAPGDRVQGGVAVMAVNGEIRVHPYVFRLICTNGAIRAHAVQTRRIAAPKWPVEIEEARESLREAVQVCARLETFAAGVGEMRSAMDVEADNALSLLPYLSRVPAAIREQLLALVLQRFTDEGDRSRFGLMNAVTSVARDTRDPDVRWRLEELGALVPVAPRSPSLVARERVRSARVLEVV